MATKLVTGRIYVVDELLPIHETSNFFDSSEKRYVIPDGENFVKVKTRDGFFAIAVGETYMTVPVIHANGETIPCLQNWCHYVIGRDSNNNSVYFESEEVAEANEYKFSFRWGRFMKKDAQSFYGDSTILNYHHGQGLSDEAKKRLPVFVTDNDEWRVGVELEKEDSAMRNKGNAYQLLQDYGWRKETDGSLNGSTGYELVSPIMPLLDIQRIEQCVNPVLEYVNGGGSSNCGGHINLSRKDTSDVQLLEGMKGFAPILYSLWENRLENRFCEAKEWQTYFRYNTKYSAFFMKGHGVVELRLPNRVKNWEQLKWRIQLMQLLLGDFGNNINQYVLKMSSRESALYKHLRKVYTHEQIREKIALTHKYSVRYKTGTISKSIRARVNDRFGETVIPVTDN